MHYNPKIANNSKIGNATDADSRRHITFQQW
jgi:hypothetical protein